MNMKIISSERRLCTCCMEEHEVKTVSVKERVVFKDKEVEYEGFYLYCDLTQELYMNERQITDNDIRLKDAYRRSEGLLTSSEIGAIRTKYGTSQCDMCIILGWGGKTITRYESHQVQDRAHDTILKKIDRDPEWFLELLDGAKNSLPLEAYLKYYNAALAAIRPERDIAKAIKEARVSQNITQEELAERAGMNLVDIVRLESGTISPTFNSLKRLAEGMGMILKIEFTPKEQS